METQNRMQSLQSIDQYISCFPEEVQEKLRLIRETVRNAAPEAEEIISYGMPAFKMKRILVYFAAFPKHIGFYPTSSGIATFEKKLATYKHAKGSVQFPLNQPLPLDLISAIVQFRVEEERS